MMSVRDLHRDIERAGQRIAGYVRHTALHHSEILSEMAQGNVHIKLENEQLTGSFKIRGAFNKLLILKQSGRLRKAMKGPTVASTGNHALACNYALKKLGLVGSTYVPTTISKVKEDALKRLGAEVMKHGADCMDGEILARKVANDEGRCYISPYNDLEVIAGQGTIGLEIYKDLPSVDVVFIPVGGGGLAAGIAAYLKSVNPNVKVIGCQPVMSKVMYESIQAGSIVYEESGETLSEGTAGGIEEGAVTFGLCRDLIDEWVMVTEDEIADAVYFMVEHHQKIVEGATGCSLGAFLQQPNKYKDKTVVIIACGANIGVDKLKVILNRK